MKQVETTICNEDYQRFFEEIVELVQDHRTKAVQAVQSIANQLYWSIGDLIIQKQTEHGWGKSIVEQLSNDLTSRFGGNVSWSPRNLWFMRQLVDEYTNLKQAVSDLKNSQVKSTKKKPTGSKSKVGGAKKSILKQPVSELKKGTQAIEVQRLSDEEIEKVKQLVSEVPWGHNILILQRVKGFHARIFYLQTTIKNRYSRAVLLHQIESDAYNLRRLHPAQNNFARALPTHLQEQTQETIKSIYMLDFLDGSKAVSERELEKDMVEKVKRFMMELGYGFCFVGNQHRITLCEKEYFIDLLFYHRILKCLVAVEIKTVGFEPEFLGKLAFCLHLLDHQLRQPDDQPSIGIILVPNKNHLEVEYALQTVSKPIGVSEYKLNKELPRELKGKLPTTEDFHQILTVDSF
jgi:predicted nuclease of restriction endonuclease-like (RecB) superfamily